MRIRSIRPEFWASEDVSRMDWHTRLVFIGLWSYVDDNGVGRDSERLIVAALFPLDEDFTEASRRVTGALATLSDGGQVTRYEADGRRFLHIAAWSKHQRIEKRSEGRYPLPTCGNTLSSEGSRTPTGTLPEGSTPGEGEKRRRGEEEKGAAVAVATPALDDTFATFWDVYPRRDDRLKARKAWATAVKRATPEEITAGAARYRDDPNRDPSYTKLGATWLNAGSWSNGPLPARGGGRPTTQHQVSGALALAQQFRDSEPQQIAGPR